MTSREHKLLNILKHIPGGASIPWRSRNGAAAIALEESGLVRTSRINYRLFRVEVTSAGVEAVAPPVKGVPGTNWS